MKQAFTLIELAIVLIILGLLAGGVLYGQNLMRAAELRSVASEFEQYKTAAITFKGKYFYLPGDMPNAADFWGFPGGSAGNCPATAGSGTETCNGDGNGEVDNLEAADEYNEGYMFWQHMANANLISGSYTGIAGSGGLNDAIVGENVPAAKISNAGWTMTYWPIMSGDTQVFDGEYNNFFTFGSKTAGAQMSSPVFTAEEMWNIDTKIDDGLPAVGKLVPRNRANCTNATAAAADSDNFDSVYDVQSTDIVCAAIFRDSL